MTKSETVDGSRASALLDCGALRETSLRPILVHTLDREGQWWRWFIGFVIDNDVKDMHHLLYFEGVTPRRASIEHFDRKCSAHYWFELWEIERARADVQNERAIWKRAIDESWESVESTLRAWNTGAI